MKTAKDYMVFSLDVPSLKEAEQYIELLSEYVGMFKVGLELFISSGPEIIKIIKTSGKAKIFLDLKLHDIPATVSRAMASIADLGVDFATVHCGENKEMLEAAVAGSAGKVGVVGVTVLTSVSGENIDAAGFRSEFSSDISRLVMNRAKMAKDAGCAGIVCSGLEVKMIKENFGKGFIALTPGIRPSWEGMNKDDQRRITTPAQAIDNGSDYLIIGRPIRDAKNPKEAAIHIAEEIESVLYSLSNPKAE
ncbi:MAG: orotidine-5'-phosphate decarboxylase [Deltaproteobacteria bacterium]|jgi:orotidine-5'-phosphate decarboxylase|nr:orotidine-5'-phosphate decarboxylase [Deltaproteobacteria bacterium]